MNHTDAACADDSPVSAARLTELPIAQLVGKVYECAPVNEKLRLMEHLLHPLGVLALVGVAHGAFARIWLRSAGNTLLPPGKAP